MMLLFFIYLNNLIGWYELKPEPDGKSPFAVVGWAVSREEIPTIEIFIDKKLYWQGKPFFEYPTIKEKYPDFSNSEKAGFWVFIDLFKFSEGKHKIEIFIFDKKEKILLGENHFERKSATPFFTGLIYIFFIFAFLPLFFGYIISKFNEEAKRFNFSTFFIFILFLFISLYICFSGKIFNSIFGKYENFFSPLSNYDGKWYIEIAEYGYEIEKPEKFAFFPLFPFLLKIFKIFPLPVEITVSIFNIILITLSFNILGKIYEEKNQGILFYLLLPFSFFYVAVYTESLFLFLTLLYYYSIKTKNLYLSLISGYLAGITRINGILIPFLSINILKEKLKFKNFLYLISPVAGFLSWCLYLFLKTKNPFMFLSAQSHFGRERTFHPGILIDVTISKIKNPDTLFFLSIFMMLLVLSSSFGLIFKKRYNEGIFCIATSYLPLWVLSFASLNRYLLPSFPAFIYFGNLIKNKKIAYFIFLIELIFLFYFSLLFARGIFVG